MGLTHAQQKANIIRYENPVIEGTQGTTLLPSVAMAQLILETGYMQYIVGNNLYGIKAAGPKTKYWDGAYVKAGTTEYIDGKPGNYSLYFRKYKSEADSIKDRTEFLKTNGRYAKVFQATTYQEQCRALQAAGYATAPAYANILISIIEMWNLSAMDQKKKL